MNGKLLKRILLVSLVNGLLLGFLMKWVEELSGKQVYQLLLNVDFIPLIGGIHWSEAWLLLFHLIVSFMITYGYVYTMRKRNIISVWSQYGFAILFIISAILLYFPLSVLSEAELTQASDLSSFILWALPHFFYTLFLPISIQK